MYYTTLLTTVPAVRTRVVVFSPRTTGARERNGRDLRVAETFSRSPSAHAAPRRGHESRGASLHAATTGRRRVRVIAGSVASVRRASTPRDARRSAGAGGTRAGAGSRVETRFRGNRRNRKSRRRSARTPFRSSRRSSRGKQQRPPAVRRLRRRTARGLSCGKEDERAVDFHAARGSTAGTVRTRAPATAAEGNRSVKKAIRSGTGSGRRRAGMSYVRVPRNGRGRKPPRPRLGRR